MPDCRFGCATNISLLVRWLMHCWRTSAHQPAAQQPLSCNYCVDWTQEPSSLNKSQWKSLYNPWWGPGLDSNRIQYTVCSLPSAYSLDTYLLHVLMNLYLFPIMMTVVNFQIMMCLPRPNMLWSNQMPRSLRWFTLHQLFIGVEGLTHSWAGILVKNPELHKACMMTICAPKKGFARHGQRAISIQ